MNAPLSFRAWFRRKASIWASSCSSVGPSSSATALALIHQPTHRHLREQTHPDVNYRRKRTPTVQQRTPCRQHAPLSRSSPRRLSWRRPAPQAWRWPAGRRAPGRRGAGAVLLAGRRARPAGGPPHGRAAVSARQRVRRRTAWRRQAGCFGVPAETGTEAGQLRTLSAREGCHQSPDRTRGLGGVPVCAWGGGAPCGTP